MNLIATHTLKEYERCEVECDSPSDADIRLAKGLGAGGDVEARLGVTWLSGGKVALEAKSWVGRVRLSNMRVQVEPKFVGGSLQVLRMLEYAAGVRMLKRLPVEDELPEQGRDLFDLICLLLSAEALDISRDGLLRNYRQTSDSLEFMRGRMRYRDQYLRRFGQLDRIHCDFDEYDTDNAENQFVAAALQVARQRAGDPSVRTRARRMSAIFDEACAPLSRRAADYRRALVYDRRNSRYRAAHELAALVLDVVAFDDLFGDTGGTGGITSRRVV